MGTTGGAKGFPRLAHKKSRKGCKRCRQRRVKCDETHPICGGCQRHNVDCEYEEPSRSPRTSRRKPTRDSSEDTSSQPSPFSSLVVPESDEPPETRDRRLLELRLLHHYMTNTSLTFLRDPNDKGSETQLWSYRCVKFAFDHDALLYSVMALTALHLVKTSTTDFDAVSVYSDYLNRALRAHQNQLNNMNKDTADATCVTSSLIRTCTYAMLSERPQTVPYSPPSQWLSMASGSGRVFLAAWDWIKDNPNSISLQILMRKPLLTPRNTALFSESNRRCLLPLLNRTSEQASVEPWDSSIADAYALTLSYLGGIIRAIREAQEPELDIGRRLIVFPMLIPRKYIDLVVEERPRALVILAFYFALLSRLEDYWYFGTAGRKEVVAIHTALAPEWQSYMPWPLKVINEFTPTVSEPFT